MKSAYIAQHIGKSVMAVALATGIAGIFAGCSDNMEDGLYADNESHIALTVSASGFSNGLLEIGSAQSETVFTVGSTTRWTVDVTDCEGAWCQIVYGDTSSDQAGQIGDGVFMVEAAPNRSGNTRECNVTVYAIESDGTHIPGRSVQIHVEQDRQSIKVDYAGDVISPFGTTAATQPTVTVTANQAWNASSSNDWVRVVPGPDMTGDGFIPESGATTERSISFNISVDGNPGTSTRYAEVTISSPTSAFTPIRLNVTQEGSSDTFFVTPNNVPTVTYEGTVVELMVYSPREAWTASAISAGDWLTLDRTSGEPGTEAVTIRATVSRNTSYTERQAAVVITRTDGMGETVVTINQQGDINVPDLPDPDTDPKVSKAWIEGGWSDSWAQLHAYYVSPVIEIIGCGAFVHPVADENAVREIEGTLGDNNEFFVNMDELSPKTEYKAWGFVRYVVDGQTMVTTGAATYFATPDKNGIPGQGDNNPPSVN